MEQAFASSGTSHGLAATVSDVLRRLRSSFDWQQEIDDILALLGRSLDCHRTILFKMRGIRGEGFAQSIFAHWIDLRVPGIAERPTLIVQSVVESDPLLARLAEEVRQGKVFAGHTREIGGFLRQDFERQKIKSFLSVAVIANGYVWGTLAVNDCVREREWTEDERAVLEAVGLAISDAIMRSQSESHIQEIFRRTMLQASLDGIVIIDEAGGIIEFNPAAETMFGWRRHEVLGKNIVQTIFPAPDQHFQSGGVKLYLEGAGGNSQGRRIETRACDARGEMFPIELTISEVRAAGRRLVVGAMRDLREKRRAEEEINRQREKLHQNEKMAAMGSLLAGVSHELNNPLAVVVAQSTLLHEFAPDPQTKGRAEKVRAAAERCGRIVKSFLGMVRLHPSAQAETDLNQVVRSALEVTAYGARSSGISIDARLSPDPLFVIGDADHLTQVAANFLVNSQHALASVHGDRAIRITTAANGAGAARLIVEDNGPGVPKEIRDRIFESYFTTKPVGVGTGIGLSISKSIVERHNGKVWYETSDTGGARFVVELPLMSHPARAAEGQPAQSTSIRNALIIDDEPDVASSLSDILDLMGIKSTIVSNWPLPPGSAALETDLVFSDLRMPGATGIEILKEVVEQRPGLASRFVLVTGDSMGARAEIEMLPRNLRPLLLEKPFSTLDVRGVLSAVNDQIQ